MKQTVLTGLALAASLALGSTLAFADDPAHEPHDSDHQHHHGEDGHADEHEHHHCTDGHANEHKHHHLDDEDGDG